MARRIGLFSLAFVIASCGSTSPDPSLTDGANAGGSGKGGSGAAGNAAQGGASAQSGASGGGVDLGQGAGGNGTSSDCAEGVGGVIFVVSAENVLLSFEPQTHVFTKIGALNCPVSFGASPFSMAVDRQGIAYVLYDDGNIFRVSTKDASCSVSGFQPNQHGFHVFGMGWVSDTAGSNAETLFLIDASNIGTSGNQGLASIDPMGMLTPIANFDMGFAGRDAEVTGTGDGRLFAFFVDLNDASSTSVAEIDKTTAHVISNAPQQLPPINAWAFAFWGGSFYLFNGTGTSPSRVDKYDPKMGTTTEIVSNAGYSIVGAGVSTCAPTTEPPLH